MSQAYSPLTQDLLRIIQGAGLPAEVSNGLIEQIVRTAGKAEETGMKGATAQQLAEIGNVGRIGTIRERSVASVREMQTGAAIKEQEIQNRIARVSLLANEADAIYRANPEAARTNPRFIKAVGLLKSADLAPAGGGEIANDIIKIVDDAAQAEQGRIKRIIQDEATLANHELGEGEADRIVKTLPPGAGNRGIRRIIRQDFSSQAAAKQKAATLNENIAQETAKIMEAAPIFDPRRQPEVARGIAEARVEGRGIEMRPKEIEHGRTGSVRRFGALGGIAALAAALGPSVLSKIFGGEEQGQGAMSPQVQMMLAMQMAKQGGAGGAGDGVNTSRTLTDMTKMVTLLKMLGDFSGGQAATPSVARLI